MRTTLEYHPRRPDGARDKEGWLSEPYVLGTEPATWPIAIRDVRVKEVDVEEGDDIEEFPPAKGLAGGALAASEIGLVMRRQVVAVVNAMRSVWRWGVGGDPLKGVDSLEKDLSADSKGKVAVDPSDELSPITADTDTPLTFTQMAEAWDKLAKPTSRKDEPLPFDPDDYPLY